MSELANNRRLYWFFLVLIVISASILLWRAPAEQTLGSGIKSVYVHVALTWTGMTGLALAGLCGLLATILNRRDLISWANTLVWVSLAMFAGGLAMSVVAAGINWGSVFWQEPRTNGALQVLAVGLIVQGINSWPLPLRLKGVLYLLPAAFLAWSLLSTPLVLHPDAAARSSPSLAIRFTFFALFVLCCLFAAWIILWLRHRKSPPEETSWIKSAWSTEGDR